jgi:hypothetical protein
MRQAKEPMRPGGMSGRAAAVVQRRTVRGGMHGSTTLMAVLLVAPMLVACDKIGLPGLGGPSTADVRRDAEGRAIGGACRHAGRAIEDCFALNRQADKAAIFAGWREMNDYMAEKDISPVPVAGGDAATSPAARNRASTDGR